jgi:hypothetical protein
LRQYDLHADPATKLSLPLTASGHPNAMKAATDVERAANGLLQRDAA